MNFERSSAHQLSPQQRSELPERGDNISSLGPIDPSIASFDRQISRVVRNVTVPSGLRARILNDLQTRREMRRQHHRSRRSAFALVGIAASFFLVVLLQPFFGRPALDAERLATKLESIHRLMVDDAAPLTAVVPTEAWPKAIDPRTCVGQKVVEFLGQQTAAYRLSSGPDQAMLIILPARQFPFQLGKSHVATTHSALHIVTHYFAQGRQVCILVVRDGTDIRGFRSRESLT